MLLARTLMNDPALLLLDEPSARLDLGGREQLVEALAELTTDPDAPPLILVTHHLDEVPPGMTHVLMLRDGQVVSPSGPIDRTLTSRQPQRVLRHAADTRSDATTADSALGRHQLQQALPPRCDLIGEHPLQHPAGPQRAAVVQVHRQRAEPVALDDRGVEHPWRMVAAVGLDLARTAR